MSNKDLFIKHIDSLKSHDPVLVEAVAAGFGIWMNELKSSLMEALHPDDLRNMNKEDARKKLDELSKKAFQMKKMGVATDAEIKEYMDHISAPLVKIINFT